MKIKFKNIMERVEPKERIGLSEYHKKHGGKAALQLCRLKTFYDHKRA